MKHILFLIKRQLLVSNNFVLHNAHSCTLAESSSLLRNILKYNYSLDRCKEPPEGPNKKI